MGNDDYLVYEASAEELAKAVSACLDRIDAALTRFEARVAEGTRPEQPLADDERSA